MERARVLWRLRASDRRLHQSDADIVYNIREELSPLHQLPEDLRIRKTHEERGVRSLLWDLLIAGLISAGIILFLYQPVRVEGTSMLPVLEDQDRLFINKLAYSKIGSLMGQDIHRGDVVVFQYPHDRTKSYIKRVIALPGDDLRIEHGQVWVNGKKLKEVYVPVKYEDDRSLPDEVIPQNEYFVMGDHRLISSDSRDFGPVERELIYGRAAFVYWPVDQAGVVR